jgi:hypothetical protein
MHWTSADPARSRKDLAIRALGLGSLLWLSIGCGAGKDSARYTPPEQSARDALEAVLRSWQSGEPAGMIETARPRVGVVDTHRRPGQRLARYEILGEVSAEGQRTFVVRLALEDPREEQKARYLVVGIDPLWVFRQEDYDMLIHWDCARPDEEEKAKGSAPKTPVGPEGRNGMGGV